jgi:glucokinase
VLAPVLRDFGADVLVIGGSMAQSWALFDPWFHDGAAEVTLPPIRIAADADGAPLVGAAYVASRSG